MPSRRTILFLAPIAGALTVSVVFLWGSAVKDGSIFGPTVGTWVEAIGSIAAVTAAAIIAGFQSRQMRLREALQRRQLIAACAHVAEEAGAIARRSEWTEDLEQEIDDLAAILHLLAGKALEIGDQGLQVIRLERSLHGYAKVLRQQAAGGEDRSVTAGLRRASRALRAAAEGLKEETGGARKPKAPPASRDPEIVDLAGEEPAPPLVDTAQRRAGRRGDRAGVPAEATELS